MTDSLRHYHASESPTGPTPGLVHYRQTLLGRLDERLLCTPAVRIVLAVLLGVILVVPSIQFVHRIEQIDTSPYRESGQRRRTALGRWLPTAAVLADDDNSANPYGFGHWFPTPPFVLTTLVPFTQMGYTAAGIVWAALKVIGFLAAMLLLIREFGVRDRGSGSARATLHEPRVTLHEPRFTSYANGFAIPVGVMLMTGIFALRPIVSDIQHGNLNTFMMIWLALAWVLYMRQRDFCAGLLIGLAIVTKITPALVLVYFLYKRSWRVCLGAGVGLVLFFIILPSLYLGLGRNIEYLTSWHEMLVRPVVWDGYVTFEIANQSLHGVFIRLLSNAGILSIEMMPANEALQAGMEEMARAATPLGSLLRPATTLVVIGVLAWLCRLRCSSRRDPRLLLEFGLVLLAMLLLSERTWKHHGTALPIVYLGVWVVLTCYPWSNRFRKWFVAGLVVQLILLLGTSEGLLGERLSELMLDGGVYCWGLVLCFLQTAVLLKCREFTTEHAEIAES